MKSAQEQGLIQLENSRGFVQGASMDLVLSSGQVGSQAHFPPGDIWQYIEMFLVATAHGVAAGI